MPRAITGSPRGDALRGALLGAVWMGLAFSWFPTTWRSFGGPGGAWTFLALVAVQAAPVVVALATAGVLVGARFSRAESLAVAGALLGGLSAFAPVPLLPVHPLAGSLFSWPAGLVGRTGLTAVLLGLAGLSAERPRSALGAVTAVGVIGLSWGRILPDLGPTLRVGIVESGVGAFEGRTASTADARADRLLEAIHQLPPVDLLVGPEGAWPFDPGAPGGSRRSALAAAWVGVPPAAVGVDAGDHNAIAAIERGEVTGEFDKQILVPGSERRWLGLGRDRYRPGVGPRRLQVSGVSLGPLICYEDLFPSAVRDAAGADVLLAAANDAWNGPAAWAHLAAARLAAVESGRWIVRPTTSGISAAIDPSGRIVWATPFVDRDEHPEAGPVVQSVEIRLAPGLPGAGIDRWIPWLAAGWVAARVSSWRRRCCRSRPCVERSSCSRG